MDVNASGVRSAHSNGRHRKTRQVPSPPRQRLPWPKKKQGFGKGETGVGKGSDSVISNPVSLLTIEGDACPLKGSRPREIEPSYGGARSEITLRAAESLSLQVSLEGGEACRPRSESLSPQREECIAKGSRIEEGLKLRPLRNLRPKEKGEGKNLNLDPGREFRGVLWTIKKGEDMLWNLCRIKLYLPPYFYFREAARG